MRGYVVKKGKNYYAVVYDGIDAGTGKEKRKWVSAGPRRSDAEKLVTDLVKRRNKGASVTAEKLSLGMADSTSSGVGGRRAQRDHRWVLRRRDWCRR